MWSRLFLAIVAAALILPASVGAQLFPNSADTLSISYSPEYPRPYEQVTVTVRSTLINLTTADITLSFNGAVVEEGERSAVVMMGGPGTRNTVKATVVGSEGTFTTETVIIPAEVALIIEADSTAHPFYEGGRLVPSEGDLRLIALPDIRTAPGTRLQNKDIAYTWRVDGRILESESGFGKNVLAATAPPRYRDAEVSVTAETRDHSVVAYATTVISPLDPLVRMYRSDPLRGVEFAHAVVNAFSVNGAEESFRAVPYFFKEPPKLSWMLNGNRSGVTDNITVRSNGGAGSAVLMVRAEDEAASVAESVTLQFTDTRQSTFFGL